MQIFTKQAQKKSLYLYIYIKKMYIEGLQVPQRTTRY